jgi:hypothetical protein
MRTLEGSTPGLKYPARVRRCSPPPPLATGRVIGDLSEAVSDALWGDRKGQSGAYHAYEFQDNGEGRVDLSSASASRAATAALSIGTTPPPPAMFTTGEGAPRQTPYQSADVSTLTEA